MLKFLPKVRNNSEIDSSCQSNPLGELNDSLTSFILSLTGLELLLEALIFGLIDSDFTFLGQNLRLI